MQISNVIAQLRTTDLSASIDFYTAKLGLALGFRYQDFYAGICAGNQMFHLKLVDETDPSIPFVDDNEHFHLYLQTDDVSACAEMLKGRGVTFVKESHGLSRVYSAARPHQLHSIQHQIYIVASQPGLCGKAPMLTSDPRRG
jgi:catechol 2,3-dioxygenase-like lactoylglutathione lyase family enzyme